MTISPAADRQSERGSTVIEFPLAIGLILIPFGMLVLSAPTWVERQTAARDAAAESARSLVASGEAGSIDPMEIIRRVEAGYGLPVGALDPSIPGLELEPGGSVTVAVTVEIPALSLPVFGSVGSVPWTVQHTERIPDYGAQP